MYCKLGSGRLLRPICGIFLITGIVIFIDWLSLWLWCIWLSLCSHSVVSSQVPFKVLSDWLLYNIINSQSLQATHFKARVMSAFAECSSSSELAEQCVEGKMTDVAEVVIKNTIFHKHAQFPCYTENITIINNLVSVQLGHISHARHVTTEKCWLVANGV